MKVKLLADLTSYHPLFKKDVVGESDMKSFVLPDQPWRTWIFIEIDNQKLRVGIDSVECLDERYKKIKELQREIEQDELLRKLRAAVKIYYVVGKMGGVKGIRIKNKNDSYFDWLADKEKTPEVLKICEENTIDYEKILEDDFNKLPRN